MEGYDEEQVMHAPAQRKLSGILTDRHRPRRRLRVGIAARTAMLLVTGLMQPVTLLVRPLLAQAVTATTPRAPTGVFDHGPYDALLRRYVTHGRVNYAAFAKDASFAGYLASLDRIDPATLEEHERLAFWLNVYNAFTIHLVASRGETETIRNIEKTFGFLRLKGPWSTPIVHAGRRTLTLDDVMHNILRKEFSEPRVHFALNYAAVGSPPLRSEAYRGALLDAQLDDQGRRFLRALPTQNRMEQVGRSRILTLSPIFTYYRADFGASRADFGRFLAHWFDAADRERLERGAFMTAESTFDWRLNK